jgi:DNA-binding NtrC family response regulator
MSSWIHALLIHGEPKPMADLKLVLEALGIKTSQARRCAEAEAAIDLADPPALIFTDPVLTDGTWIDVAALTERFHPAVPLIVVSRFVDLRLYLDVLERGAADFIVPPFRNIDVAHVIKGALAGGFRFPFSSPRAAAAMKSEVRQRDENHPSSRVQTSHA